MVCPCYNIRNHGISNFEMLSLGPNEKLHSTSQPVAPQVSADPTTYQLLLKQQTQLLNLGLQKQHQQHGLSSSKSLSNSTTAVMDCDNDGSNSVEPGSLLLSLLQMCLFDCPFFSDPFFSFFEVLFYLF